MKVGPESPVKGSRFDFKVSIIKLHFHVNVPLKSCRLVFKTALYRFSPGTPFILRHGSSVASIALSLCNSRPVIVCFLEYLNLLLLNSVGSILAYA